MNVQAVGFWGTTHWILDVIGRGAACVLSDSTPRRDEEACAMMGGGALGVIFGAAVGLLLSDQSRDMNAAAGAALGALVGACSGVI